MDWGTLKAQLTATMHRKDINWQAQQEFAIEEISRDLDVIDNESMQPLVITQSVGIPLWEAPLPPDFGRIKALIGGGRGVPWAAMDLQALMAAPDRSGRYAISGTKVWMGGAGPGVMIYGQRLVPMVADTDTNVILSHYPHVYLHCLAKWGFEFAQDGDQRNVQESAYRDAIIQANANKTFQTRPSASRPSIVGGIS